MIGLEVDESIQQAVDHLNGNGVRFVRPIINDAGVGAFADFEDPDGNSIYLWETRHP